MEQTDTQKPVKKRRILKPSKRLKTVCGTPIPPELKKSLRTLKKRLSEIDNSGIHPLPPHISFKDAFKLIYYFDLFYYRHGVMRLKLRRILNYVLFSVLVDSKCISMLDIVNAIDSNNYAHIRKDILLLRDKFGFLEVVRQRDIRRSFSVYPSTYLLRLLQGLLNDVD